jgi:hypothetical protein
MPRTKRPAVARAQDARAERQRETERELLTAPCRHHGKGAVCDQCVSRHGLDSLGFPTVAMANGRGRYRLCQGCAKLRDIPEWNLWTDRCQVCVPPAGSELGALPQCAASRALMAAEQAEPRVPTNGPHRLTHAATGLPVRAPGYEQR